MDTGTKVYRNYFPIKFGWQCDCRYGELYPVFRKLMYPGDVFKIHADLLIRYQPMLTPPMNDAVATVRFAFVPLRLIEQYTELIVTGSKDGHLSEETIPVMDSCFKSLLITADNKIVEKHSHLDMLYGIPSGLDLSPSGLLAKLDADKASPALYFEKAFARFWWDYYRDENLYTSYDDFELWFTAFSKRIHMATQKLWVNLKKDRITSSLPWQLKASAAPMIEINGSATFTPNYTFADSVQPLYSGGTGQHAWDYDIYQNDSVGTGSNPNTPFGLQQGENESDEDYEARIEQFKARLGNMFNKPQSITPVMAGFTGAQFREMMAQTRIFERLARCGSRYTEYLRANFGIAPADDTLQRAQYLGGFKTRIVTTEVVQTASDGDNPVGTLRGHGITHGTANIKPYMAKEIGVMIGVLDIKPETIYAQGVDRELTVRSRFDFFNPSFQHLSEQEVRKGEVYFGLDTDNDGNLINSQTWGFQPYAQELRTGVKHVVGDMRDSLSYWNQALIFSSRPSLNQAFIRADYHTASYNRPFAVNNSNAYPMIVDFGGIIEAYRPLVKNGTPGLVDHN